MTTSLSPTVPEAALAGAPAAAPTLLDLLASTTPEGASNGIPSLGSAPAGDFAALLAPSANAAPVILSAPAPATPPAAPESAPAPQPTTARAFQLKSGNPLAPTALIELPAPVESDGESLPVDRATLEAALALVAAILPPPATPVATPQGDIAFSGDAACADNPTPGRAAEPMLRVTLTTPGGAHIFTPQLPENAAPAPSAPPVAHAEQADSQRPASPATPTTPATPAVPATPATLAVPAAPAALATPARAMRDAAPAMPVPVPAPAIAVTAASATASDLPASDSVEAQHAELEWEGGLKLSAEFVTLSRATPATASQRSTERPATKEGTHTATPMISADQTPRSEKNAVPSARMTNGRGESKSDAEITFLPTEKQGDATEQAPAGINIAKTSPAMPATQHPPHSVAAAPSVAPALPMRAELPPATTPAGAAQRAVDVVLDIVHAQAASKLQPMPSVQLRFKVGHEDLAVRVQLRDGEVHTEFRTDNAELRAAVTHEWRAVTAKPDAALRFLDPVFSAANQNNSSTTGQGGSQQQHSQQSAAQQQQHQQQQFRTQMELFGTVRRGFPAAAASADLAPVTPLTAASNHRLSAVA